MSEERQACLECGWPMATDEDNDRDCSCCEGDETDCMICPGLCWAEFNDGCHREPRDDALEDARIDAVACVAVLRSIAPKMVEHGAIGMELWRERQSEEMDEVAVEIVKMLHMSGIDWARLAGKVR